MSVSKVKTNPEALSKALAGHCFAVVRFMAGKAVEVWACDTENEATQIYRRLYFKPGLTEVRQRLEFPAKIPDVVVSSRQDGESS